MNRHLYVHKLNEVEKRMLEAVEAAEPPTPRDLYDECVKQGFETDHHESDLYIAYTPFAEAVVRSYCEQYPYVKYSFFTDSSDRTWIEVPFHYSSHWHRT